MPDPDAFLRNGSTQPLQMGLREKIAGRPGLLTSIMRENDFDERTKQFAEAVSKEFAFLEQDFGYRQFPFEIRDAQSPQDAHVRVPFLGKDVGVDVVLGLGEDSVSVVFYELEGGQVPAGISFYEGQQSAKRAISLESLIRKVSGTDEVLPLPSITPGLTVAEMVRRGEHRTKLLRGGLRDIVARFAKLTREYGSEILSGNTSDFASVQAFHTAFWNWSKP